MKVPSVKDYLRNHTNIVTVDKKSVFLYLHQDGYNDKDDDVLSFKSSRNYCKLSVDDDDDDGDGADDKDGDDDPKSTNLVVSQEMVQQDLLFY